MIFRNPDTGVDLPDAVVRPISRTSTPMDPDREIHLESITVAVSESQIPSQNPSFRVRAIPTTGILIGLIRHSRLVSYRASIQQ